MCACAHLTQTRYAQRTCAEMGIIEAINCTVPLPLGELLTNGYAFNFDKSGITPTSLSGADLTIMDTSESGAGEFGKLEVTSNGKLTLEGGTLEKLSVQVPVDGTRQLRFPYTAVNSMQGLRRRCDTP